MILRATLLLLLLVIPGGAAAELPTQDNELILGVTAGPLFVEQPTDASGRTLEIRTGVSTELLIGLMSRATPWLDGEIELGFVLMMLAEQGFEQTAQGRRLVERNALPGALLRGKLRARVFPAHPSWTLGLGLTALFVAAPATGAFTRLEIEATTGYELSREAESHMLLEIGYAFPLLDGLRDEPGVAHTSDIHRVLVRFTLGF